MSKHTQGEWKVIKSVTRDRKKVIKISIRLFDEYELVFDRYGDITTNLDKTMSNAKLIAAAPKLLEAGQEVIKWASEFGMSNEAFEKLSEAIKQATE